MRYVKYLILIFLLAYQFAYSTAMAAPSKFVYQGQIIKPNGQPLESANVEFIVEIFSPGGEQCLLYQERHVLNLINSNGLFSLTVGEGTRSGSDFEDTSTLNQAFNNFIGTISSATCAAVGTYTPGQADSRRLRIKFDNGSGLVTIPQDQWIHSVPFAQQASSIDGITSAELLRVNETGSLELTQSNLEQVFDGPNFTELIDLINGTSSQYLASGSFSAPLDLNSQKIANLADPTVGTDATNKNYVDQNFGGAELDLTGLADGQTLVWNATDSKWEVQTFSSTDNTKLPLAGGQMSGGIDMNGNAITNATNIGASNNLTVGNDLTVTNDISVTQDLSVGNDTTINNNLSVGAGISVVGGIGVGTGINSAGNIHIQDSQELRLGDADNSHYVGFKAPALVTAGASFVWELPAADGTSGQLLQTNGGGVLSWVDPPVGTLVSVSNQGAGVGIYDNTNSGDVELRSLVAASSKVSISLDAGNKEIDIDVAENNFDSSLIPNTASGSITATNVQAAINELDTNKVATGFTITTAADSGLTGGGDLSTNRSLSIDIAGTTDLGAPADNADSLLLRDNTDGSLKEVTRAQLVLSETEVDSMVSNNGYAVGSEIFKHDGSVAMTGNINTNNNSILNLELGSPAAPSISFNGDDNTGIFSPAPNSVAISTDGNEALSIDSNGRVGIGTTTPSGRLDIEGGDVFIGTGTLTNASGADDLSVTGNIEADGNVYANAFYGDGSNLTGISITPPLSDVASATSTNFIDNLNYNQNWIWSTATTETAMSMNAGNLTSGTLLRLNSSGTSLSAQTSSATANAIVGSNTAINGTAIRGHSEAGTGFGIGVHGVSDSLTGTGIYGEMYVDNNTANGVQGNNFGATNDGSGVYGANNGASNLGYGVFGENSSSTGIGVRGYNSSSGIGGFFSSASGNALITGSGNVGIGTDTPSGKLDIEGGDVFIGPATLTNASANEDLSVTGNIEVDGIIYGDGSGITNISANGIDHDSLSGFVANEHIDHSTVFIATAANSGLSGGGNITTTRNIAIDIAGTDDLVGLVDNADSLLIRDNTDGSLKEITRAQLVLSETEVDALVSNNGYLTSFSETDPKMQTLSSTEVDQLENIDAVTISNTQWGYLGNMSAQPLETVTGTVLDNVFSTNGLLKRTGAGTYVSVTDNSANWDAAYSSVNTNAANWNTAFGWGDHSAAGYAADSAVFKHNGTVAMTGDINLNNNSILNLELGTAAAPSISFNGDDNTGIFSPAPDNFSISTAGNEAFTIDSSGNIGIGTSTPASKLHIITDQPSTSPEDDLTLDSYGDHPPSVIVRRARTSLATPTAIQDTDILGSWTAVGYDGSAWQSSARVMARAESNFDSSPVAHMRFDTNGGSGITERMRITGSGNVGIGITNPSEKLEVSGNIKATQLCIGADCRSAWPGSGGGGTVTNIATGTGLTGGPITGTGTISIANGGVDTTQLADSSVTSLKIADGAIATVDIADDAITSAKLADTAVSAGAYGSATEVPTFTVDAQGRLTAAANVSISESDPKMQTLSSSEVDQLENIDAVTISNAQWGYLGNMSAQPLEAVTGTVLDNVFSSNGLLKRTGAGTYVSVTDNSANWDAAYSSVNTNAANWNTAFGWGDHSGAGYAADSAVFKHNGTVAMTGDINLNNNSILNLELGTAAAPSISFNGDDNTGIFSPAPDSFAISTAGNEAFTIDSSGNVGIGTTGPAISIGGAIGLEIQGSSNGVLKLGTSTNNVQLVGNQFGDLILQHNGSARTAFKANGNMGVGAWATPSARIHQDSGNSTPTFHKFTAGTATGQNSTDGFDVGIDGSGNALLIQRESADIRLSTDSTERMRILANGNIGVGTTDPQSRLQIAGGVQIGDDAASCVAGKSGTLRYNSGNVEYCNGSTWGAFSASETDPKMQTLSASEVDQLENIDAVTISNAQWGYLGNMSAQPLESVTGTVLDNVFSSNGLLKRTGAGTYVSVTDNSANWDAAFGWGDHSGAGYAADSAVFKHNGTVAMTGNINANDNSILNLEAGSAAAPSISFNGDDNTGIFSPAPDSFSISTAGNEALTINSSGNVGIGTSSPDELLHLLSSTSSSIFKIEADPSNSNENHNPYIHFSQDGGNTYSYIGHGGDSGNAFGGSLTGSIDNAFIINALGNGIQFATEDIARMTVAQDGNVGIGTNDPSKNLEVSAADTNTEVRVVNRSSTSTHGPKVSIRNYSGGFGGYPFLSLLNSRGSESSTAAIQNNDALGSFEFVGVYNTAGGYSTAADVRGESEGNFSATSTPGRIIFRTTANSSTSPTERMRIDSNGNVGIGTNDPTAKLDVNGTVKATSFEGALTSSNLSVADGSAATPSMTFSSDTNTGFYSSALDQIGVSVAGNNIFDFSSIGLSSPTTGGASVRTTNGTASNPTFSFSGDEDTGWFRPSADTLAASTGGTERMRLTSSGNVGIGTNAPGFKLHAQSSSTQTSAGNIATTFNYLYVDPSASSAATFIGQYNGVENGGATAAITGEIVGQSSYSKQNSTSALNKLSGSWSGAEVQNTGTVTTAVGAQGEVKNLFTGTITEAMGLHSRVTNSGGGSITNGYGVYIDQVQGSNRWSLYANDSAPSYLGGKLGIGSTNPYFDLEVTRNDAHATIRTMNTGGSTTRYPAMVVQNYIDSAGSGWPEFYGVTSRGTLGSPQVTESGDVLVSFMGKGTYNTSYDSSASSVIYMTATETFNATNRGANMTFLTTTNGESAPAERMRIDHNGFIGIGTTNPADTLDIRVSNSKNGIRIVDAGTGNGIQFQGNTPAVNFNQYWDGSNTRAIGPAYTGQISVNPAFGFMEFSTSGNPGAGALATQSTRMMLTQSGNLGIGTSNPSTRLDIGDGQFRSSYDAGTYDSISDASIYLESANPAIGLRDTASARGLLIVPSGTGGGQIRVADASSGNIAIALGIDANGNVGIGTTTPSHILHITGQGRSTNSAWATTSDIRLKDVQGEYSYGLNEILNIPTYRFKYKKGNEYDLPTDKEFIGTVAQELQQAIPEAVEEDQNGYLTVNTDPVFWATINAVQELHGMCKMSDEQMAQIKSKDHEQDRKIASLEEENAKKDKEIEDLKRRLDTLEKLIQNK